ncbi:hypothetical protein HEO15_021890, partial [Escherichia coli]|nr:hypothetical protein [Escherichia coli]
MLPDSSVRLNKYISESGICSRREADRYIEQGNVLMNPLMILVKIIKLRWIH